jgi:hypothetical protein
MSIPCITLVQSGNRAFLFDEAVPSAARTDQDLNFGHSFLCPPCEKLQFLHRMEGALQSRAW